MIYDAIYKYLLIVAYIIKDIDNKYFIIVCFKKKIQ